MKNWYLRTLFLFVIAFFTVQINAQTLKQVLHDTETPIFYYGIDFTQARLINDPASDPADIVARQFAGLNVLMINEAKKYDIAGAFRRSELPSDLSYIDERNKKADPDKLTSSNTEDFDRLKQSDIQTLIKGFNGGNRTGTGLLLVVEGMSKTEKAISAWVVLFDIKGKKVLMAERMKGKVGMGFSFRNYWATGLKSIIDQISKSEYKKWKTASE